MAVVCWAFGWISDVVSMTDFTGVRIGFLVLRMPALGRFIRPFAVAGDFAKYFLIMSAFMNGIPSRWPLDTAFSRVDMGALKKVWCIYFS
mgnify:CR=1 FL=1